MPHGLCHHGGTQVQHWLLAKSMNCWSAYLPGNTMSVRTDCALQRSCVNGTGIQGRTRFLAQSIPGSLICSSSWPSHGRTHSDIYRYLPSMEFVWVALAPPERLTDIPDPNSLFLLASRPCPPCHCGLLLTFLIHHFYFYFCPR